MVVCNKIDIVPLDELSEENKEALKVFEKDDIPVLSMSTMTDEGIMEVKQTVIISFHTRTVIIPSILEYLIN